MIISCNNCHKNFDVDTSLIPEIGRLLMCSSCDHKWFYKKESRYEPNKPAAPISPEGTDIYKKKLLYENLESIERMDLLDNTIKKNSVIEKILNNKKDDKNSNEDLQNKEPESKKNVSILGLIIVFMISFIALIIVLDTLQGPISKIVPNIEFLLYSLYESINDIKLFLIDLF